MQSKTFQQILVMSTFWWFFFIFFFCGWLKSFQFLIFNTSPGPLYILPCHQAHLQILHQLILLCEWFFFSINPWEALKIILNFSQFLFSIHSVQISWMLLHQQWWVISSIALCADWGLPQLLIKYQESVCGIDKMNNILVKRVKQCDFIWR